MLFLKEHPTRSQKYGRLFTVKICDNTTGNGSISIGHYIENSGARSIIIGSGYSEQYYFSNSAYNRLLIGFLSTKPTLVVFSSPSSPNHDKTGHVGIGNVTDPQAKLHLRSDNDEPATFLLEPSNWTSEYNAEIFMGNIFNGISAEITKGLVFKTENNYLFNQGNLGLGTDEPAAKIHVRSGDIYIQDIEYGIIMKSPDGTCWRGTVNNQGQLTFEALNECPEDALTTIKDSKHEQPNIKIHPNPAKDVIEIEILDKIVKDLTFSLIDETGKVIKSVKITKPNTTVSTANLPSGLYFGNFTGEHIYYSEKIIKQ